DRHHGIGGDGIILIEKSDIADAKVRVFNLDGSEAKMGGNALRSVAKYLYDNGEVKKEVIDLEMGGAVISVQTYTINGKVSSACVNMGRVDFSPKFMKMKLDVGKMIDYPIEVGGKYYHVTCLSIGNPHCVLFRDRVDELNVPEIGPLFEHASVFKNRMNTEFVRVVNETTLKMRVWERGNGETYACGSGACAAAVAAVENGYCKKDTDITVKVKGGDLIVRYTDDTVYLTGNTKLVYNGILEY
nr:diaminopimelate epimerase [Clostridiales bacterium]